MMTSERWRKSSTVLSALALVAAAACTKSPATPSDSSMARTDAGTAVTYASVRGVTVTTPQLVTPAANAQISYASQPITLTVKNAVSTASSAMTYTFQVASDGAFGTIVQTKDGVNQGAGQTSVALDQLGGNTSLTYYWRARANVSGAAGPFSGPRAFVVGPNVVLGAPVLVLPGPNGSLQNNGSLSVNDVTRSGPVTQINYIFEVSDSQSFANIVFTATVGEQPGQTSTSMTTSLTANATYYWRVRATDLGSGVVSANSQVQSFKYVPFDFHNASIISSPFDFADWGQTASITSVTFTGDAFLVDFDKRDSPDRWIDTPFGSGTIQYTLGLCGTVLGDGHWYCSAVVLFWYGRELTASGRPDEIGLNWFYDPARWGPMTGWQPQEGETVGVFVCAGVCRNNVAGDKSYIKERSNAVFVPWTLSAGPSYTFAPVTGQSVGRTSAAKKSATVTVPMSAVKGRR